MLLLSTVSVLELYSMTMTRTKQGYKGSKAGLYKCDNCGKGYTLSHVLSRHKWKCKGLREIICQVCQARFYRMDSFKKHMGRHGL
ncbi:hypothetical protein Btru_020303 [Bulinus truncatus]|nr:hypothetical protein Btru_020303 [Bulinus truncatus]